MKKVRLLTSTALLGLMFSIGTSASTFWKFGLEVAYLSAEGNGLVQAMFFENGAVYKACGNVEYYSFEMSESGGAAKNSYLLAAHASKQSVSIVFDCSTNQIGTVRLDRNQ